MIGGQQVAAVHLDHHRGFPLPPPFLEADMGQVSTPDTPADSPMSGDWRIRAKLRALSMPTLRAIIAMQRSNGATGLQHDWAGGTGGNLQWRWGEAAGTGIAGPRPP